MALGQWVSPCGDQRAAPGSCHKTFLNMQTGGSLPRPADSDAQLGPAIRCLTRPPSDPAAGFSLKPTLLAAADSCPLASPGFSAAPSRAIKLIPLLVRRDARAWGRGFSYSSLAVNTHTHKRSHTHIQSPGDTHACALLVLRAGWLPDGTLTVQVEC